MSFLYEEDTQRAEELGTAWYRSKEVFPQDIPYAGYLTNKKWPLNEVMSLHLIMLQQARNSVILCYDLDIVSPITLQAGLIRNEAKFTTHVPEETLEPLGMEHLYFRKQKFSKMLNSC